LGEASLARATHNHPPDAVLGGLGRGHSVKQALGGNPFKVWGKAKGQGLRKLDAKVPKEAKGCCNSLASVLTF